MKREFLYISCVLAIGASLVSSAWANGVLGQHNWDIGAHGWTNELDYVGLTAQPSGGHPDGYLEISFDVTSALEVDEVEWVDVVRVDADLLFAGNWTTNQELSFDFFSADETPNDLQVQMHSSGGNVWSYNATAQVTEQQAWSHVRTPLSFDDAWGLSSGFGDTSEQFLADLGAVDWVGLYIFREEAAAERYGLDNFTLHVGTPEPGEYVLLAAALCMLLLGYRRRPEKVPVPVREESDSSA